MEQRKKIKTVIAVLAVLLGISVTALGGTLIYSRIARSEPSTVEVPDNLITPEGDTDTEKSTEAASDTTEPQNEAQTEAQSDRAVTSAPRTTTQTTQPPQAAQSARAAQPEAEKKEAVGISLYSSRHEENLPFKTENMFPGDAETRYFRVRVSYHDAVTVHFGLTARPGYEKLAEVMQIRIRLLTTGKTMYDGPICGMPDSVSHLLMSKASTTEELYYEITAYLDTSVGNEYQSKALIADLDWWVEETGNLDNAPQTGDGVNITLIALLALISGSITVFLLVAYKHREEEDD